MADRSFIRWMPAVLALLVMGQAPAAPDVSTTGVVAAAAAYLAEYQRELTFVVAEESYRQQITVQRPADPDIPRVRQMRSEVFFLAAPDNGEWMTIRDVLAVDGAEVQERPDLREALRTLPPRQVAATFKEFNSRYNIGRIYRNFNEPTLSLLVLDPLHRERFSFDRRRVDRDGEVVLVTIAFRERESPTLIFDKLRGRVLSRGDLVIEAGSGTVRRATLTAEVGPTRLSLRTDYAFDAHLEMWVPSVFREEYQQGASGGNPHEEIACEAWYSNYRRFETSARIRQAPGS
jgi:hypothetical protein